MHLSLHTSTTMYFAVFSVPTAPINLRVLGCTITQLKIGWDPPEEVNGTLKGYYIYLGRIMNLSL